MGTRLVIDCEEARPLLEAAGLVSCADFLALSGGELVARSNTTTTRRIRLSAGGREGDFFLKVYHHVGPGRRRRLFRDKCALEARNYRLLRERCGTPVPVVVAHGARRRGLRVLDSFIMTRAIAGGISLEALAARPEMAGATASNGRWRRQLSRMVADIVARMHAAEFFHIDLQWRNLLVCLDHGGGAPRVHVLDCVRGGVRRTALGRAHGRVRDLSSLHKDARHRVTRSEELRWLRCYLGVPRLRDCDKSLIRAVLSDRRRKDAESAR